MKSFALIPAFALFALSLFGGPAAAQTEGTATAYQDWTVQCRPNADGSGNVCQMVQSIFADEARTQQLLHVVVGYPQPGGDPGMILVMPLGISLPPGVFVGIDETEPQRVPVERCERSGCRVELLLAGDYLQALKQGTKVVVHFHDRGRRRIAVPFSLLGFTAALQAVPSS